MADKASATLLSKILNPSGSQPDQKNINRLYIEIILNEEIPVICVNQDTGKKRLMPFKVLYDNNEFFWQQDSVWKYYISGEDLKKIQEKAVSKPGAWEMEREKPQPVKPATVMETPVNDEEEEEDEVLEELEVEVGYGADYGLISQMDTDEKKNHMFNQQKRLNDILSLKVKETEVVTEALVDTAKDTALINHAALEEAMILGDDEAKKFMQEFVDSTSEMVKLSAMLMSENVFNDELMKSLVEKSNGTIVQHMTRVYLNGISFLTFYNNLVTTSSAVQRFRISFPKKYRPFYKVFLPHLSEDDVDLEHVFLGGMRAIPPDMFFKWAVGFLIHDIGKADSIQYHEGEESYDRSKVIEHVKAGYKSLMTKTNYPMEASLITGYHHEYYGAPDGYGYFRAYLQQYKRQNPSARQDFVISYDLAPMIDYQALAYFPAKVLEIIDVYDSITDPNRVYRKAMTPESALNMMKNEFVDKNRKLDTILFDIFEQYIQEKIVKTN